MSLRVVEGWWRGLRVVEEVQTICHKYNKYLKETETSIPVQGGTSGGDTLARVRCRHSWR